MYLSEDYLEDEVREGFYVSGMIKKIWASALKTLDFVNRFCSEHNIRWFLSSGTLLGAVRHQGFIPWDDDVDIIMLREDFNRFLVEMKKDPSSGYIAEEQRFQEYDDLIPLVSNSRVQINFDADFLRKNYQNPYAATLDVFVLDTCSNNEQDEEWRDCAVTSVLNADLLVKKLTESVREENSNDKDSYHSTMNERKITEDDIRHLSDRYETARQIIESLDDIELLTNHKMDSSKPLRYQLHVLYTGLIAYFLPSEGSRVRVYPGQLSKHKEGMQRVWYESSARLPFENMSLPVPADYDAVLRYEYGDYRKKVVGGAEHSYPVFTRYEKKIIETAHLDKNPFVFSFTAPDLPKAADRMPNPKTDVRKLLQYATRMEKLLTKTAAGQNTGDALYLLEIMQNNYMQIGNIIECSRGEKHPGIYFVEQVCEVLYRVYIETQQKGLLQVDTADNVLMACVRADEQIREQYSDVTDVLFLIDRAKNWKAVESLCMACIRDPSCHVSVMIVPWHPKNGNFAVSEETRCDILDVPDTVSCVSADEYDISLVHPDIIVTTYGCDFYNYVRVTDQKYYTSALWKETDCLIYIPWFTLTDFGKEDPQWATVPYFARIPGVLYADQTIVQSERMKRLYIDAMEEMDDSVPEQYWDKKILALGSPLWDWKEYTGVGPDENQTEKKADQSYGEYIWKMLQLVGRAEIED
jgi:phosphorylcholine metabolism protein LicD